MSHTPRLARSRHFLFVTATPRAMEVSSNERGLPEYAAVLSHEDRGVTSFKVKAASERVALAEITRWANRLGKGWKIAVYEGLALVATREPGARTWQHAALRAKAAPLPVDVVAPDAVAPDAVAPDALRADLERLRDALGRLRDESAALGAEHAALSAALADLREAHAQAALEDAALVRGGARVADEGASRLAILRETDAFAEGD